MALHWASDVPESRIVTHPRVSHGRSNDGLPPAVRARASKRVPGTDFLTLSRITGSTEAHQSSRERVAA
jgi:hypothetical protein